MAMTSALWVEYASWACLFHNIGYVACTAVYPKGRIALPCSSMTGGVAYCGAYPGRWIEGPGC